MSGTANYQPPYLTIKTMVKRGKKMVEKQTIYRVTDVKPTPSVAHPAYSLERGEFKIVQTVNGIGEECLDTVFVPDGEVWHVHRDAYGNHCSCPHATFRGHGSKVQCKHVASMLATGILTK